MCGFIYLKQKMIFFFFFFFQMSINPQIYRIKTVIVLFYILNKTILFLEQGILSEMFYFKLHCTCTKKK